MQTQSPVLNYTPKAVEEKWYKIWQEKQCFKSNVDTSKEPYTIVIPPPNVTGILHMGHMLNNTIQDILIRRARMTGKNACWVPGTDHASIATEAKVVDRLKQDGIDKNTLSREDFLSHAWEWKHKYGGIILEQLKKLGASCDWDRVKFTMDDDMSEAVIDVFIDLHKKGLIYRGVRMINWDPQALTALSDEEVIHKDVQSKLYHVKYVIKDSTEFITIATTRPETILGDTAVCVHPNDERYTHLVGKTCIIPIVNREVPIIADEYIDIEFGTGALKVTPAHDINDYNLGIKHNLPVVDCFNDNGTIADKIGHYVGQDRFAVRKQIAKDLEVLELLVKTEDISNRVGYSERTNAVIEPRLSLQWFCNMKELAKPALDAVMNDEIKLHPAKFKNTYRHWMENVKDWCISRQLWWGQRIPAFYDGKGNVVVAKTKEEAFEQLKLNNTTITLDAIYQDEDCLDTWFSSWLWPISVFDGIRNPENEEIKYYYPTNTLVTAPEILFFWVARMAMAGFEYRNQLPFKDVYLTGIVRDKLGRKMSKSLGNSPDLLELIDKYGADGVRVGILLSSPAGNDLIFDTPLDPNGHTKNESPLCEQGAGFSLKLWNAYKLVNMWEVADIEQPEHSKIAIEWFKNQINKILTDQEELFSKLRLSDALMQVYKFAWDDFCSWYLEAIKPAYQQPIDRTTYTETIELFKMVLKILHPFVPFVTEELWSLLGNNESLLIVSQLPKTNTINSTVLSNFEKTQAIISEVRNFRANKQLSPKESLKLFVKQELPNTSLIKKLANITDIEIVLAKPDNTFAIIVGNEELYIPMVANINIEAEKQKLQKELEYSVGFLKSVSAKLSNEKFVANAKPEILANERKKQADTEARINAIEKELASL